MSRSSPARTKARSSTGMDTRIWQEPSNMPFQTLMKSDSSPSWFKPTNEEWSSESSLLQNSAHTKPLQDLLQSMRISVKLRIQWRRHQNDHEITSIYHNNNILNRNSISGTSREEFKIVYQLRRHVHRGMYTLTLERWLEIRGQRYRSWIEVSHQLNHFQNH
jgi:hypothetical protein